MSKVVIAGVLVVATLSLRAGTTSACTCDLMLRNQLSVSNGLLPNNAAGIPWWFTRSADVEDLTDLVTLQRWGDGGLTEVPATVIPLGGDSFLVAPVEPWSTGERYRLQVDIGEELAWPDADLRFALVEVEIGEGLSSSVRPRLVIDGPKVGDLRVEASGECDIIAPFAYVDVFLRLDGLDERYPHELLHFSTSVDGQPWEPQMTLCQRVEPGSSWLGRNGDRIAAPCDAALGLLLPPGQHRVRMEARLPGTDVIYTAEEISVVLECPPQNAADADAGAPAPDPIDASAPDPALGDAGSAVRPESGMHEASGSAAGTGDDAIDAGPNGSAPSEPKPERDASATKPEGGAATPPRGVDVAAAEGSDACAFSVATRSAPSPHGLWSLVLALGLVLGRRKT